MEKGKCKKEIPLRKKEKVSKNIENKGSESEMKKENERRTEENEAVKKKHEKTNKKRKMEGTRKRKRLLCKCERQCE